ncbi:hypothetical protein [Streptomyces sp. NPDC050263]|uniref:hypothetical protein n=1 Tax=Streptomyces sp. NPDC050263 TaxID=3155037 RepID=UPI003415365A
MSTEELRASVPRRPDVPPRPGVPPRPTTPPRPPEPPTAGPDPDPDPDPDPTDDVADPTDAANASPSPDPARPVPPTASRFFGLRAQHTDDMTPPPPPASARFPDIPPRPSRPASTPRHDDAGTTPGRAEERPSTPKVPRPTPPHDFRRAPRTPRPAASSGPAPTGPPPVARPAAAPGPGATVPEEPRSPRWEGSRAAGPDASRPSGVPPEARSVGSDGASAADADSAWTPLPRGWVPAPGPTRQEAEAEAESVRAGQSGDAATVPGTDEGPAWTPAAALLRPDFTVPRVPPVPSAPPTPPVPEARRRSDTAPDKPGGPDPALSWSAPMAPGGTLGATRPVVTFAEPEGFRDRPRTRTRRGRSAAAAVGVVLGLGLIGGAVTGSWLVGDSEEGGERSSYTAAAGLWHNVPVDQLFPLTVDGQGAGPGGADRTWTRIAVAPDSGCADAFDPLLLKAFAAVGCQRLLRATYTDATQSYVTTVGLLFTDADAAAMRALDTRFSKEGLAERADLMPRPYAAKDTVAAAFGDKQRAAWTVSVLTDAPVVVYAVSGWADGRTVDTPQPAPQATATGATTAPAQAGLGNEAQGLADRIERGLRKTAATPSEQPS